MANLQKAKIVSEDDSSKEVVFQFNPEDFTISRTIEWEDEETTGGNAPRKTFSGGKADKLTINLLFDTTDTEDKDVRDSYQPLLDMTDIYESKTNPRTGKGEPHHCKFIWGGFLSFRAVITKVTQKFTMFRSNGTPVRAEVTVELDQLDEEKPARQNPTSYSEPRKIWVVREGETLDWIAYQEYGDPAQWRHIAETNSLMNPKDLHHGQILKLVPLP